jgi:hypothetical protein
MFRLGRAETCSILVLPKENVIVYKKIYTCIRIVVCLTVFITTLFDKHTGMTEIKIKKSVGFAL